jgi:[acyl-carrier-protein] S-malonyltransferase
MGKDLYETFPEAKKIYDRAEEVLSLPIKRLSFEGPESDLRRTGVTQPAILVHSLACLEVVRALEIEPRCVCGHSLGEYAAVYAARALDLEALLKIVRRRGELMEEAGLKRPGAMAAIIGLEPDQVLRLCTQVGKVWVVNFNAPDQVVISGEPAQVEITSALAKERGARRAVPLSVSGAFHSPLMAEAARKFEAVLKGVEFRDPQVGVIVNITGELVQDAWGLRQALMAQLSSPVQWVKTIETARGLGVRRFFELGPSRVLTGLARRIDPELSVTPLGRAQEFWEFRKAILRE